MRVASFEHPTASPSPPCGGRRGCGSFPLLFGLQQGLEGLLWLDLACGVTSQTAGVGQGPALGFLFFAYVVWPSLVPLAAWRVEDRPRRRRLFAVAAVLGGLLGGSLYIPLIVDPDWLQVMVLQGSILYHPRLIYDPHVSREVVRAVYALIVALPLVGASNAGVRRFGMLILGSVILTALAFGYAFVSIWCFFAALLSAYPDHLFGRTAVGSAFRRRPRTRTWRCRGELCRQTRRCCPQGCGRQA